MASDVEKLARELLAKAYKEGGFPLAAESLLSGRSDTLDEAALSAIAAALTQPAASGEVVAWLTPDSIAHLAKQNGVANVPAWNCSSGDERVPVYASPQPDADTVRLDWLESGFYGVMPVLADGWETRGECPRHRASTVRAAIDSAIKGEK